jgi:hypothetical protein
VIGDWSTVTVKVLAVAPAEGVAAFRVRYVADGGPCEALLPCDPLPAGGDLVQAGRLLRLTLVDELIVQVAPLVSERVG